MKKLVLFCLLFSSLAEACRGLFTTYNIQMTCGDVAKVRNGKILRRLEPSLFGINDKYVLRTKFLSGTDINETGSCTVFPANPDLSGVPNKINFTKFGNKQKFQELKYDLKSELRNAKQTGVLSSLVSDISAWVLLDTKESKFIIVLFQLKMRLNKWELGPEDISKFILKKRSARINIIQILGSYLPLDNHFNVLRFSGFFLTIQNQLLQALS